jgi:hypothetical protein
MLDISFAGKSPADLTELGLRSVLLGEPNPLADQHMSFATEMIDPLAPLRQAPVSEEIIRPLAELLITELLVGSGRARSVTSFRLGVAVRGMRHLTLAWQAAPRYANERLAVRTITADVKI